MIKTGPPVPRQRVLHPLSFLRLGGGAFLALVWLAVSAAQAQTLGTASLLVGPAAGTNSVELAIASPNGAWTNTANASWLQLLPASASGKGSTNVLFAYAANTNSATRTNTLTIAGQTLTVTQAGSSYIAVEPVTTLASNNLDQPYGVAVSAAGHVYIADTFNNAIKVWSPVSNTVTLLVSSGLSYPAGVAVDGAGNVYIADTGDSAIKEWVAASNTVTDLPISGLSYPYGVAVDGAGNVYIADTFNNAIKKWSPASNTLTTLVSASLNEPQGVAVDAAGNVYIADTGDSEIKKWTAANSNVTVLVSSGLAYPGGVAVDGGGNVYIADTDNDAIKGWSAASNAVMTLPMSGLFYPSGVAVDGAANVYAADTLNNAVEELPYAFVDPAPRLESEAAGSDALPAVLNPPVTNLPPPFAPASEAAWLSITGVTNGVVSFSFSANTTGANRAGGIALLGQVIPVIQNGQPPSISTQAATGIGSGTITLNASVNPEGAATAVYFVYGLTTNYGSSTAPASVGNGTNPISASNVITGLLPDTLYHFEAVAGNSAGTSYGGDLTFSNNIAATYLLGASSLVEGAAAGTDSVVLGVIPQDGIWTAAANASWLHLAATNESAGSTNIVFTFDKNTNSLARSNTLTIAGQTLTVTQAGANYDAVALRATLAGSGLADPLGVAVDTSGNVYFADSGNNAIKEWTAANNTMTNLVSSGLNQPWGVAVDTNGNVYFADSGNDAVKEWTAASGLVTNLVSSGLSSPRGLAVDVAGNLYIADTGSNAIIEWTATNGGLVTLVSNGLAFPSGVAVDVAGNVYIADTGNNAIREWLAGDSNVITLVSNNLENPSGVAVDGSGNVYIAGNLNDTIMEWTSASSNVLTLVSNGLSFPSGVAVDSLGNLYLANTGSNAIQELPHAFVDAAPRSEPNAAGNDALPAVLPAAENLLAPFAPSNNAAWLTLSLPVTNGVVDFSFAANNGVIRTTNITVLGVSISVTQAGDMFLLGATNLLEGATAGSDSVALDVQPNFGAWTSAVPTATWLHLGSANQSGTGSANVVFSYDANTGATRSGAIVIAGLTLTVNQAGSTYVAADPLTALLSSSLDEPYGVAVDAGGNVYIADSGHAEIKEWVAADNTVTSLVSSGLSNPRGVAVDVAGNVYISDYTKNALYKWTATNNTVTSLVSSRLNQPWGVAVDTNGDVYIADYGDLAVKEYSAATSNLTTVVSSGLLYPSGVAVDIAGNVYIADTGNNAIKMWSAASSNVTTLGSGFAAPSGVAVDGSGNVYIADTGNNAVKKWIAASAGVISLASALDSPSGVTVDAAGNVYLANTGGGAIEELPHAFVDPSPKIEGNASGADQLPTVLPATANLSGPFTPTSSDTNWLTVNLPAVNGVVSFSFASNTNQSANRTAYIDLLGQNISITQGVIALGPPILANVQMLGQGVFQFTFTNNSYASFTVLSTTNLSLPLSQWTVAGTATNVGGSDQFQFTSSTTNAQLFFIVRSP